MTPFTPRDATFRAVAMAEERTPEEEYGRLPEVVDERSDTSLREPAAPLDPFTPEPGARPGERRAFRTMWLAIAAIVAFVALILILYFASR
jgi:hypothetical protein